jgi:hypothetical protein
VELVISDPMGKFLVSIGKRTTKELLIASPFITDLGLNRQLLSYFKRRNIDRSYLPAKARNPFVGREISTCAPSNIGAQS